MATHKYIYWHSDQQPNQKGETFANVHLLVGYNQASLADFREMAEELRKTFPQATDEEICGGKVFKSGTVQGFTIITWSQYLKKGDYPDWYQKDSGQMEYHW